MPKFSLIRVRLTQGGYDRRGEYFGVDVPLFQYATEYPPSYACDHQWGCSGNTDPTSVVVACPECDRPARTVYNDVYGHVRAYDRYDAKAKILRMYPDATFYR